MSTSSFVRSLVYAALVLGAGALPAAAKTAEYRVTSTATWSAETHPTMNQSSAAPTTR